MPDFGRKYAHTSAMVLACGLALNANHIVHSQVFSSNDTGCGLAEGPLYPDEKSDKAKYDDDDEKKREKRKKKEKKSL